MFVRWITNTASWQSTKGIDDKHNWKFSQWHHITCQKHLWYAHSCKSPGIGVHTHKQPRSPSLRSPASSLTPQALLQATSFQVLLQAAPQALLQATSLPKLSCKQPGMRLAFIGYLTWVYSCAILFEKSRKLLGSKLAMVLDPKPTPVQTTFSIVRGKHWKRYTGWVRSGDED